MLSNTSNQLNHLIKKHYKIVEDLKDNYSVVGAFLFGFNNYVIDEIKSERIKTIVLVIPTLNTVLLKQAFKPQVIKDDEHSIEIVDIESIFQLWMQGNPHYLEVLFTDYKFINPQYTTLIGNLLSMKEHIASYNKVGMSESACTISQQLKEAFNQSVHETSYDSTFLYYVAHLYYSFKNFCEKERTFEQSMIEIPENLKYLYTGQTLDGSPMDKDEAEYKVNYYCNVIKMLCDDLKSLQLKDLSPDEVTYGNVFNIITDIIQYGLTNKLSGNSEEIKKLNTLILTANQATEEKERKIKEMKAKHKKQLEMNDLNWKSELQKINEQNTSDLKEKNDALESTREIWASKVISLKQEQETYAEKSMKDHLAEIEKIKKESELVIRDIRKDCENSLFNKEKEWEESQNEYLREIQKIKDESEFKVDNAKKINESIIASITEEFKIQLKERDEKITELLTGKEDALNQLKEEHASELAQILASQKDEKQTLIESMKNEMKSITEESEERHRTEVKKQSELIDALNKKIDNQRSELKRLNEVIHELENRGEIQEKYIETSYTENTDEFPFHGMASQITDDPDLSLSLKQEGTDVPKKKRWWNIF